uniref:Uncharacterized protein n=1 Tax=Tetraselmis sp. GSL018 TaxID=582737 RepID=A0A061RBQ2_9CHLO
MLQPYHNKRSGAFFVRAAYLVYL